MGEYAYRLSDGEKVKIGTCENLALLRYEDRVKVRGDEYSMNPAEAKDCFWRLPHPDEDGIPIGEYREYERGLRLFKCVPGRYHTEECHDWDRIPFAPDDLESGWLQLRHECGLFLSAPCYHGLKDYHESVGDFTIGWNGRDPFQLELISVKNTREGLKPVFRCRHCKKLWRCEWSDVIDFVWDEQLKARLVEYATGETK